MPLTDEEWENQKVTIHELWTSSTLKEIANVMADIHGFCATKSQYETRFAKWNWRKNLNSSDWSFVLGKKRRRAALGKETEATLNGCLISQKRIKKEEQRLTISQLTKDAISCPSPAPPEGIHIFTPCPSPASEPMMDAVSPNRQDIVLGPRSNAELPFFKFVNSFNWRSFTSVISKSSHGGPSHGLDIGRSHIVSAPSSVFDDFASNSDDSFDMTPVNLPRTMISDILCNAGGLIAKPDTQDKLKDALLRRLKVSMLDHHHGDLEAQITRLLGNSVTDAIAELVKLMIYFSSNAMLDLSQQKRALEWITSAENKSLLKMMFSTDSQSLRAFLDSMLQCAMETRNTACGKALLDADHNRNLLLGRPGKLLQAAIRLKHTELVQILESEGVIREVSVEEARTVSVTVAETPKAGISGPEQVNDYVGWLDVVPKSYAEGHASLKEVLTTSRNVNLKGLRSGRTILQYAIEAKDLPIAEFLVKSGAEVNAPVVGSSGHLSLLQLALAIEHFPKAENIELIKLLLQNGADVNALTGKDLENGTPLQIASSRSNMDLVKLLLNAGARLNEPPDYSASTAFQAACHAVAEYASFQPTNCDIVKHMVGEGADINAPPAKRFGRTAFQLVVSALHPSLELVEYLLEQDGNVYAAAGPMQGITALQGAAIQGHLYLVKLLLDKGADANAPAAEIGGRTALEGAAERGRLDTVQMLLDAGADSSQFASAVAFAEKRGHYVVADLIKSHMDLTQLWNYVQTFDELI